MRAVCLPAPLPPCPRNSLAPLCWHGSWHEIQRCAEHPELLSTHDRWSGDGWGGSGPPSLCAASAPRAALPWGCSGPAHRCGRDARQLTHVLEEVAGAAAPTPCSDLRDEGWFEPKQLPCHQSLRVAPAALPTSEATAWATEQPLNNGCLVPRRRTGTSESDVKPNLGGQVRQAKTSPTKKDSLSMFSQRIAGAARGAPAHH